MPEPITEEEKREILVNLKSFVPATRYLVLRKIGDMADTEPERIKVIQSTDRHTFSEIVDTISYLKEHDREASIRREATITMEKIKQVLGTESALAYNCKFCGSFIEPGWNYCSNCGRETKESRFSLSKCPGCGGYIEKNWLFCTHCGRRLKTKRTETKCPQCKRKVEETWMMCPYCGFQLKEA